MIGGLYVHDVYMSSMYNPVNLYTTMYSETLKMILIVRNHKYKLMDIKTKSSDHDTQEIRNRYSKSGKDVS